ASGIGGLQVLGRPSAKFGSAANAICPAWFRTMEIPLIRGREFKPSDRAGSAPVAIVNETFARRYLPDLDPLRAFLTSGNGADRKIYRIIGIVRDSKYLMVGEPPTPMLFLPYLQSNQIRLQASLVFRSASSPTALFSSVKQVLAKLAPAATVEIRSMSETVAFATLPNRIAAFLLVVLAFLALLLTIVGLCGVISYEISQRTRELGIRMAVGATRGQILKMLLQRGFVIVATGEAVGIALAFLLTKPMSMFLASSVGTTDPLSYIAVAALLGATALGALFGPAWRAVRLDPGNALRYE
ncbi:MAG: FtsX-like permease family protein, partial [Bryobacteraceae bacterium]